ncbi:hypothetical protein AAHE18_20G150500 [Arachis hypogaea]
MAIPSTSREPSRASSDLVLLESFLRIRSLPKHAATHREGRLFPFKRLSSGLELPSFLELRSALILSSFLALMLVRLSPSRNMLEGVGKTPILTPQQLEDNGYKIIVYPLSLIGVSIRAMHHLIFHYVHQFS